MGLALTYNFDPHWGLEFDAGYNWGNNQVIYENTSSVGPRFIWRTDTANYFVHSLVSLNRVNVSGLQGQNGLGAVLGGGMDLRLTKNVALRLFEADYVWARHNYSETVGPQFPDLRRVGLQRRSPGYWTGIQLGRYAGGSADGHRLRATERGNGGRAHHRHRLRQQFQSEACCDI